MEKAAYNSPTGPLMTPEEFVSESKRNQETGKKFAYCPMCDERVAPYGVHSTVVKSRFDHPDRAEGADPLDDCELSNRSGRLGGISIDDLDLAQGKRVRERFYETDTLRLAYAFCHRMCGQGALPRAKFIEMLQRADKKKIWCYVDIELFVIPYILLTFENFTGRRKKDGMEFDFYFALIKPGAADFRTYWTRPEDCRIEKRFCRTHVPFNNDDNPYPVSEAALLAKVGNADWIKDSFLREIIRAA